MLSVKWFAAGETICEAGSTDNCLYFVLQGAALLRLSVVPRNAAQIAGHLLTATRGGGAPTRTSPSKRAVSVLKRARGGHPAKGVVGANEVLLLAGASVGRLSGQQMPHGMVAAEQGCIVCCVDLMAMQKAWGKLKLAEVRSSA